MFFSLMPGTRIKSATDVKGRALMISLAILRFNPLTFASSSTPAVWIDTRPDAVEAGAWGASLATAAMGAAAAAVTLDAIVALEPTFTLEATGALLTVTLEVTGAGDVTTGSGAGRS